MTHARTLAALAASLITTPALAQWDPSNGEWGKSDPADLRVMTWNVLNGIASSNTDRSDGFNQWNALVRIVAALQPDVLIMQECGDGDSVSVLENQIDIFFNGGSGAEVWVKLFAPSYDLPHVFVNAVGDCCNRNVILSRYPFADINGDNIATYTDFLTINDPAVPYQDGGNGGIRGFMFAEIDLPDETYAGDIVIGNSHLKAFSDSNSFNQRVEATQNIAYLIDAYYNGLGTGTSDPNGAVILPAAGNVLDPNTPVVWGGDLNQANYSFPATTMWQAGTFGGSDGTDRDRSDSTPDAAAHPISGDTSTQSSSKLDYLIYQDSIASTRHEFVFRTSGSGVNVSSLPAPVDTFPIVPQSASNLASDHRPVILDLILPSAGPSPCNPADLAPPFGSLDFSDVVAYLTAFSAMDNAADLAPPFGSFDFSDVVAFLAAFGAGCP